MVSIRSRLSVGAPCSRQITALTRIVMKTINMPSGNAFGVDDNDGLTP
jgi:hypothetical protein